MLPLLVPFLILASAATPGVAECNLDPRAQAPILDASKAVQHRSTRDPKLRRLIESTLVAGSQVTWSVGGCTSYEYSLRINLPADHAPVASKPEALRVSRAILEKLPVNERGRSVVNLVIYMLKQAETGHTFPKLPPGGTPAADTIPLACVDASCRLQFSARELIISYDSPL